jgi:hypothetical protein
MRLRLGDDFERAHLCFPADLTQFDAPWYNRKTGQRTQPAQEM